MGAATTEGRILFTGVKVGVEVPSEIGEPEGLSLLPVEHIEIDVLPMMVLPPQR